MAPTKIEAAEISQAFSTGAVEKYDYFSYNWKKIARFGKMVLNIFYDIAAWFPKNMIIANKAAWNKT